MTSTEEEATTNRVSRSIDAAAKPPQRFRHTQAALDRLSIRRLIANERIDVDDVLAGLERDSRGTGTMKEIVEELHSRSLDDRQFSIKLSALARPDMIKPRDELNVTGLQIILIRIIQGTYESRKNLRTTNRKQYRNALSLSGEFYHRYCATDASFFCLNAPLIAWLTDLLRDTEEEDVELVARQLSINGQLLLRRAERKLKELVWQIKQHLVHRNLSVKSRTLLLYVVDLANRNFVPLSGEQRDFYARQLGDATFADFEFCGRHVVDDDRVVSQQQQQQQQTTCSRSVLVTRHPQSHFKPVRSDRLPMKPSTRYDPSKPIVVPRPKTTTTTTSSEDSFDRFAKPTSDSLPQTSRRDRGTQAAAAHHRRRDQRSGQLYDHRAEKSKQQQQQQQRGRICKSFNKDRKPIRHPPPPAPPAPRQQQQQQLDRDSSLPSSNGDSSKNNARGEATTTTTTEADDEDDVGISFKLGSWADDLPDEQDDKFVETPEWYNKSTNESFSSGKETKAGDSLTSHRRLPATKPKRYSERKSRRG